MIPRKTSLVDGVSEHFEREMKHPHRYNGVRVVRVVVRASCSCMVGSLHFVTKRFESQNSSRRGQVYPVCVDTARSPR